VASADFAKVLNRKSGAVARHQNRCFRILSVPSVQPRLGLAIAKRLMPRAVDRNRTKRLVREAFRHGRHALPARDYVVFARDDLRHHSSKQIRHDLDRLMQVIMSDSDISG
jgi:ribonuclease P protein component